MTESKPETEIRKREVRVQNDQGKDILAVQTNRFPLETSRNFDAVYIETESGSIYRIKGGEIIRTHKSKDNPSTSTIERPMKVDNFTNQTFTIGKRFELPDGRKTSPIIQIIATTTQELPDSPNLHTFVSMPTWFENRLKETGTEAETFGGRKVIADKKARLAGEEIDENTHTKEVSLRQFLNVNRNSGKSYHMLIQIDDHRAYKGDTTTQDYSSVYEVSYDNGHIVINNPLSPNVKHKIPGHVATNAVLKINEIFPSTLVNPSGRVVRILIVNNEIVKSFDSATEESTLPELYSKLHSQAKLKAA